VPGAGVDFGVYKDVAVFVEEGAVSLSPFHSPFPKSEDEDKSTMLVVGLWGNTQLTLEQALAQGRRLEVCSR
jgi:hypothetical protein